MKRSSAASATTKSPTASEDTEENRAPCWAESDDHVDAGEVQEFWKNDEDRIRMEWRVSIRVS